MALKPIRAFVVGPVEPGSDVLSTPLTRAIAALQYKLAQHQAAGEPTPEGHRRVARAGDRAVQRIHEVGSAIHSLDRAALLEDHEHASVDAEFAFTVLLNAVREWYDQVATMVNRWSLNPPVTQDEQRKQDNFGTLCGAIAKGKRPDIPQPIRDLLVAHSPRFVEQRKLRTFLIHGKREVDGYHPVSTTVFAHPLADVDFGIMCYEGGDNLLAADFAIVNGILPLRTVIGWVLDGMLGFADEIGACFVDEWGDAVGSAVGIYISPLRRELDVFRALPGNPSVQIV